MSRALRLSHSHAALGICAAISLGGCASPPIDSAPSPRSQAGSSAPGTSKAGDWLAQAWQGWQRAQANPARPLSPTPRLAFRAPAPLQPALLDQLPLAPTGWSPRASSSRFAWPGQIGLASAFGPLAFGPAAFDGSAWSAGPELWQQALSEAERGGARPPGPRQGSVSSSWSALQEAMERRQIASLQGLALRVARQRREAGADEEGLLRADLADDLERVGRLDMDSLAPALGPSERLERLSELRLKLLSALAIAPAVQRQAEAEREKIEVEIRAALREQEKERAALLVRLRREVPARLQAQRESQIESALGQVRQADAASIALLLQGQQSRVRRDFGAPASLFLPAPPTASTPSNPQISFNKNQLRTFTAPVPSLAPITPPAQALNPVQVLVPSPGALPVLGKAEPGSQAARARGGVASENWRALLARRARAWRAPLR